MNQFLQTGNFTPSPLHTLTQSQAEDPLPLRTPITNIYFVLTAEALCSLLILAGDFQSILSTVLGSLACSFSSARLPILSFQQCSAPQSILSAVLGSQAYYGIARLPSLLVQQMLESLTYSYSVLGSPAYSFSSARLHGLSLLRPALECLAYSFRRQCSAFQPILSAVIGSLVYPFSSARLPSLFFQQCSAPKPILSAVLGSLAF